MCASVPDIDGTFLDVEQPGAADGTGVIVWLCGTGAIERCTPLILRTCSTATDQRWTRT